MVSDVPSVMMNLLGPHADLDAMAWQPFRPGVEIIHLQGDPAQGATAALLRYAPGASVPWHWHEGLEYILVLRGSQTDERGHKPAGTLVINPPGSSHSVRSDDGCVVLIVWDKPVRFDPPS